MELSNEGINTPRKIRRPADYLDHIPERYCRKCDEWWPEDEEFFYHDKEGRFGTPCRACIQEQKQQASAVLPCSFAGCCNPRHLSKNGRYTSYCDDHLWSKRKSTLVAASASGKI